TLPSAANNKPIVQVRWIYWISAGTSGSRDRLGIDDIAINGTALPTCTTPVYLFDEDVVAKTTTDPAFTNEFISDNTSPAVFSSTNSAVASVDESTGLVTIAGVGSTTIKVTQVED